MDTERRSDAPPYHGESAHALWHVSDHDGIPSFEPRVSATSIRKEPLVWAIDTRHLPLFWFPRDCPRATFWADSTTTTADVDVFLSGQRALRVQAIETTWLGRVRDGRVHAYRMPEVTFEPDPLVGGYWTSRVAVKSLESVAIDDLLPRHAEAGIELRIVPTIWPLWDRVTASTLAFSGIRLRNAGPRSISDEPGRERTRY